MLTMVDVAQLEVAQVIGLDSDGRPLVRALSGSEAAVQRVWLAITLTESQLSDLVADEQPVLVAHPQGLAGDGVIVGVLRERPVAEPEMPREMILEARERLVVRCGSARMVLHGDGRCELHAERITQRARGVHAIKGAAVRLN